MNHWTLGVLIGYPVALLLLVAAIITTLRVRRRWLQEVEDKRGKAEWNRPDTMWLWLYRCGIAAIVVGLAAGTIGSYPWTPDFHRYRPVSGTVEDVSSRIVSGGENSIEQAFVVRIAGVDYRVDDTRAAQLHEGDPVSLSCIRTWQYAAAPGEVCRWGR